MVFRVILKLAPIVCLLSASACQESAAPPSVEEKAEQSFGSGLGDSLIPSPDEEKLKREVVLARDLARTLERLDGVDEARVHLSLADKSLLSKDREKRSKAAILIKRTRDGFPAETTVRDLAAASVSDLEPADIRVFFSGTSTPMNETVPVGPIEVTARTLKKAKLIIGGLLILCLFLAGGLVAAGLRLKRLKHRSH